MPDIKSKPLVANQGLRQKMSRREVRLFNRSTALLSQMPLDKFHASLKKMLGNYINTPIKFKLNTLREVTYQKFCQQITEPSCLGLLTLHPTELQAIIDIDNALALHLVKHMLDSSKEALDKRVLTDIEEQLLNFLLLKTCAHIHELQSENSETHLRIQQVGCDPNEIRKQYHADDPMLLIKLGVRIDKFRGYIKICLPHPFLDEMAPLFNTAEKQDPGALKNALPPRLANMALPFWVQIGQLSLHKRELAGLGVEDILLFDQTKLQLHHDEESAEHPSWHGKMDIYFGKGYDAIEAEIVDGRGPVVLEVLNFKDVNDSVDEGDMTDRPEHDEAQFEDDLEEDLDENAFVDAQELPEKPAESAFSEDEVSRTEDLEIDPNQLMDQVMVSVVAAIGRTEINLRQALSIHKGQILEMDRSPGDPVDVMINGDLRARGVLIDIDGKLGVQLTELHLPEKDRK